MVPLDLLDEAAALLERYKSAGKTLATAESCTGGLIAACLTEIAGSSAVVERGFVTYTNEAKMAMLGVPADTLAAHGAVSEATAGAMAIGALVHSRAGVAVSVTGVAGPAGGSAGKPVGTVCFGLALPHRPAVTERQQFSGDRNAIRVASVRRAFHLLTHAL